MATRKLWLLLAVAFMAAVVAATGCGGETVVETVVVEKSVVETVVVEKVVTATVLAATAIPAAVKTDAPEPKNPVGTISLLVPEVLHSPGLQRAQPDDRLQPYGIGENLFSPADDGTYQGMKLATSFVFAPDLSGVTIQIREGVNFHKGWGTLDAHDIAWNVNDANNGLTPDSIHMQAGDFAGLLGSNPVEASGDYTVEMKFATPNVLWDADLFNEAGQGISMFSKKAYDDSGEDYSRANIIATGPYEVVEYFQDDKIVLKAFPDYWGKKATVENIRIMEVTELATQLAMLKTGEIDAAQMALKAVPELLNSGLKAFQLPIGNILAVSFTGNLWETKHILSGEPLDTSAVYTRNYPWIAPPGEATKRGEATDPDDRMQKARMVREALAIGLDRELLDEAVYGDLAQPAWQVGAHPNMPEWQERWRYEFDPVRAEQLLDEAGYPRGANGVRFEIPLYAASYALALNVNELADAVGGMWTDLGVTTPVLKYSYSVYRPTNVTRTSTLAWLGTFDESGIHRPFDWPKGIQMTSISRGGASSASETPYAAQRLVQQMGEPDRRERIRLSTETIDYWNYWKLIPGVVAVPCTVMYNPKAIEAWTMRVHLGCGVNKLENIVSAR